MAITLVLADDHPVLLSGLVALLQVEGGFEVLEPCSDGDEAIEAVRLHLPAVAVLDIVMPKMNGLEVARRIRDENLPTRVVLYSAYLEEEQTLEALRIGVDGLLLKNMAPHLIIECLHTVNAGGQWVAHGSALLALKKILRVERGARELALLLTAREVEIVQMVAHGLRNKQIAENLCLSEGTIKVHLHNIYEKVKVSGRMALLRLAQDKGLCH